MLDEHHYIKVLEWDDPFQADFEAAKASLLAWIVTHWNDPAVRSVRDWLGERRVDFGIGGTYQNLCSDVFNLADGHDFGCGSTNGHLYRFISDVVVKLMEVKRVKAGQAAKARIAELQKEIAELEASLK